MMITEIVTRMQVQRAVLYTNIIVAFSSAQDASAIRAEHTYLATATLYIGCQ